MRGSVQLPRGFGCTCCAFQVKNRPLTCVGTDAVATSRRPCEARVLGGARSELPSSPQNFPELKQCISVILIHPSKYFRRSE